MDVFVHPSLYDGMPNAMLEAMACEVPVVVTPVRGILDVIHDGQNGLMIQVNNVDAISKAIRKILDDEVAHKMLSANARMTIVENFTPEKELEANSAICEKLIE